LTLALFFFAFLSVISVGIFIQSLYGARRQFRNTIRLNPDSFDQIKARRDFDKTLKKSCSVLTQRIFLSSFASVSLFAVSNSPSSEINQAWSIT
jgi:hypothetical protein